MGNTDKSTTSSNMRSFFLEKLKELKRVFQLRQYEEIASIQPASLAQDELDKLLMALIRVCNSFGYIPDSEKQKVIEKMMVSDSDFIGFNARIIYKWLNSVSHIYWKEQAHQETMQIIDKKSNASEKISPETQELVKKYLASLLEGNIKSVPTVSQLEIEKIKQEDEQRIKGRKGSSYQGRPAEEIYAERERLDAVHKRLGYDKIREVGAFSHFQIEDKVITARNRSEAQEIYTEVYL
ncbi:MAG TPA: hypothetical protein VL728_19670 [Cyclobacteriaceae bacterium]|nr:hypothetical protein [Cyclobacteriaceae bacterium]